MKKNNSLIIICFLLSILTYGCSHYPNEINTPRSSTTQGEKYTTGPSIILEATKTPTYKPTIALIQSSPTQKSTAEFYKRYTEIISGVLNDFGWTPDGKILCYTINQGTQLSISGYETQSDTTSQNELCAISRNLPWNNIYEGLPGNAFNPSVSPSGRLEAFELVKFPQSSPTPGNTNDGEGEGPQPGDVYELWIFDNGNIRKIVEMNGCTYKLIWSENENVIIAKVQKYYCSPCCDLLFNVINLDGRIQPVYAHVINNMEATFYDPSPSGKQILYEISGEFYLLDLYNLTSKKINVQGYDFDSGYWINDFNLLVGIKEKGESTYSLGILNIVQQKVTIILEADAPPLEEGKEIHHLAISPDDHWLAFTTGHMFSEFTTL